MANTQSAGSAAPLAWAEARERTERWCWGATRLPHEGKGVKRRRRLARCVSVDKGEGDFLMRLFQKKKKKNFAFFFFEKKKKGRQIRRGRDARAVGREEVRGWRRSCEGESGRGLAREVQAPRQAGRGGDGEADAGHGAK